MTLKTNEERDANGAERRDPNPPDRTGWYDIVELIDDLQADPRHDPMPDQVLSP